VRFGATILGSGTIIPTSDRRATSILVEIEDRSLLLDCGPCTVDSMAKIHYRFSDIGRIFITHLHPDHTLGLPHMMAALNQIELEDELHTVTVYGPSGLRWFFQRMNLLYGSTKPRKFFVDLVELGTAALSLPGGIKVRTAPMVHGEAPALAYRIDYRGKSLVYSGDTEYTLDLVSLANGADTLISECSFPDSHSRKGHMTPSKVGMTAEQSRVKKLVVVHMYPEVESTDIKGVISEIFDGEIYIAEDLFQITI